ncbi:exodeoxyribonuclease VII small subunit [Myroides sp. 1354]|uniref:exodeoxyribonuclease VII small subunit n=1 Tax=unclassified Myroides TaxID=2642485 RepID=UPI002576E53A|nr:MULTISPECIES: exodeoxyribonuclease VII small subunit [unclassified Myroides]MDM1043766.1 exodeoxyribonuclease VII small subunit [Myroides sp. R163-1]MDM1054184.1 exodeoxyribonuclease VII small subunit [Myroides sp. 1354]MDM1067480.1 exodeoxyribonuclease VII small subunit [Myroides sp. 1372]
MEKLTYEKAAEELDEILTALKNDEVTVDQLAEKVERASQLIVFCKKKLTTTEEKIEKIMDKLEE